jgi:hypothetical protein
MENKEIKETLAAIIERVDKDKERIDLLDAKSNVTRLLFVKIKDFLIELAPEVSKFSKSFADLFNTFESLKIKDKESE